MNTTKSKIHLSGKPGQGYTITVEGARYYTGSDGCGLWVEDVTPSLPGADGEQVDYRQVEGTSQFRMTQTSDSGRRAYADRYFNREYYAEAELRGW